MQRRGATGHREDAVDVAVIAATEPTDQESYDAVSAEDLEGLSEQYDLLVVCTGKYALGKVFEKEKDRLKEAAAKIKLGQPKANSEERARQRKAAVDQLRASYKALLKVSDFPH